MAIFDIFGNSVVASGTGAGEIPDGSVTPAKTTFFNEYPTYRLIPLGENYGVGNLESGGGINGHSAYKYIKDYLDLPDGTARVYLINVVGMTCYDSGKIVLPDIVRESYDYNHTDGVTSGQFYAVYSLPAGAKYIRVSAKVEDTMLVSLDPLPNVYDPQSTDFICREGYADRIWEAMGIPNLEAISRFRGKTMIVGGDSIVENNQTTEYNPWPAQLARLLGMTVYNDGQGGTGFAKHYDVRVCTVLRVETKWADLYPADPDIILIQGNMNDGTGSLGGGGYTGLNPQWTFQCLPLGEKTDDSTAGTQYGVVRRLLESLIERYPTARIGMISSTPRDLNSPVLHPDNPKTYGHGWYEDYLEAMRYVCEDMNIPFLDLYHNNVLRPWNADNVREFYWDGTDESLTLNGYTGAVHPNAKGHLEGIVRPVLQWMLSWI